MHLDVLTHTKLDASEEAHRSATSMLLLLQQFPRDMAAATQQHIADKFLVLLSKLQRVRWASHLRPCCMTSQQACTSQDMVRAAGRMGV